MGRKVLSLNELERTLVVNILKTELKAQEGEVAADIIKNVLYKLGVECVKE